jgi:Uma2 family endonuclease
MVAARKEASEPTTSSRPCTTACYARIVASSLRQELGRPATRADLDALPPHVKGEIIDGELYVQPRPRAVHANVEGLVIGELQGSYQRGRGGPGGWWILPEPGIELPGSPEFSPDVAGWRKDRLSKLPADVPIKVVPDWICEVLSPSTRGYDLVTKRRFYARIGVPWLWYVDVEARSISVSRLDAGAWVEAAVHGDEEKVRLEPFTAVEIDLSVWWDQG